MPHASHCIYCGATGSEKFQSREHVIPQSFGSYGPATPTLRCVCDECNAYFKTELDQFLARETREGLTRYAKGIKSRELRRQRHLRLTLSEGEETGLFAGAMVSVNPQTNKLLPIEAQLRALNRLTGKYDYFFRHHLGQFELSEETYGKPGERDLAVYAASREDNEQFITELAYFGVTFTRREGFGIPNRHPELSDDDEITLPVYIEGTIDDRHKRGLAKILMNFAAKYVGVDEVQKAEWNKIREYVRLGAGTMPMRLSQKPFWTGQESKIRRFMDDSINVRIENQKEGLVGVIQFYNQFTYELLLVEGYSIFSQQEAAYRFTSGKKPIGGKRGRRMTLADLINTSVEQIRWLDRAIDGMEITASTLRDRMAAGCLDTATEHKKAIILLIANKLSGSALALVRSLYEAYIRGVWLHRCASNEKIEHLSNGQPFPSQSVLVAQIEKIQGFEGQFFSTRISPAWKAMNGFTHTGMEQIARRNTAETIEANYDEDELREAIRFSMGIGWLSAIALCALADDTERASRILDEFKKAVAGENRIPEETPNS